MFHVEHIRESDITSELLAGLAERLGLGIPAPALEATRAFARELVRWDRAVGLLQARSLDDLLVRHVAEGWTAGLLLADLGGVELEHLDVGSGGGVPALLIKAVNPGLRLTMVEPRGRKAAFLRAASRAFPAPTPEVLEARLEDLAGPPRWHSASFRGIRLEPAVLAERLLRPASIVRFPSSPDDQAGDWAQLGAALVGRRPLPAHQLSCEIWRIP